MSGPPAAAGPPTTAQLVLPKPIGRRLSESKSSAIATIVSAIAALSAKGPDNPVVVVSDGALLAAREDLDPDDDASWSPDAPAAASAQQDASVSSSPGASVLLTPDVVNPILVMHLPGRIAVDLQGRLLLEEPVSDDAITSLMGPTGVGNADPPVALDACGKLLFLLVEDRARMRPRSTVMAGRDAGATLVRQCLALLRRTMPPALRSEAADARPPDDVAANSGWKAASVVLFPLFRFGDPCIGAAFKASTAMEDAGFSLDEALEGVFHENRRRAAYFFVVLAIYSYYHDTARGRVLGTPAVQARAAALMRTMLRKPFDADPRSEFDGAAALFWACMSPFTASPEDRAQYYRAMSAALAADAANVSERSVSDAGADDGADAFTDLTAVFARVVAREDFAINVRLWGAEGLSVFGTSNLAWAAGLGPVERALFRAEGRAGLLSFLRAAAPWFRRAPVEALVSTLMASAKVAQVQPSILAVQADMAKELLGLIAELSENEAPAMAAAEVLSFCAGALQPDVATHCVEVLLRLLASETLIDRLGLGVISEAAPTARTHAYGFEAAAPLAQFAKLPLHQHTIITALLGHVRRGSRDASLHAAMALYQIAAQAELALAFVERDHVPEFVAILQNTHHHWDALGVILGALLQLSSVPRVGEAMAVAGIARHARRLAAAAPVGIDWAKTAAQVLALRVQEHRALLLGNADRFAAASMVKRGSSRRIVDSLPVAANNKGDEAAARPSSGASTPQPGLTSFREGKLSHRLLAALTDSAGSCQRNEPDDTASGYPGGAPASATQPAFMRNRVAPGKAAALAGGSLDATTELSCACAIV